jgi:hypothetical protein
VGCEEVMEKALSPRSINISLGVVSSDAGKNIAAA